MKISRNLSLQINNFFDQFVPPILRDSRIFMYFLLRLVLRDKTNLFLDFKDKAFSMTDQEFTNVYEDVSSVGQLQGETDLNSKCIRKIMHSVKGSSVLEVGCGRGYLANKLAGKLVVTACDIVIEKDLQKKYPKIKFLEADIHDLPFKDKEFDTVVSTHTLEHVKDIHKALQELRRVTKRRLIIVIPKQRPYKYTPNLHLHFFPYVWSVYSIIGQKKGSVLKDLGDWFYQEDI